MRPGDSQRGRSMRALGVVACVVTLGLGPGATAQLDMVGELLGFCSELDAAHCLLPFPNDQFTTTDPTTPSGRRVDLSVLSMPSNVIGKPIDPSEWNRNDGWSPGSMLLTFVPGLDLDQTWGLDYPQLERPSVSLSEDAPIVIVDTATGERHPYWAELDTHPETGGDERLLIVRPLVNFMHGHRYVVGLRDLKNGSGAEIPARDAFARQRDDFVGGTADTVLQPLADAGVEVSGLYLAWDFTIASAENLAGRALGIRDDAFAQLGDTNLADGTVDGRAPEFSIDEIETFDDLQNPTERIVHGTLTVPNYLNLPQDSPLSLLDEAGVAEILDEISGELPIPDVPIPVDQMVPGSRFIYPELLLPPAMSTPIQNPVVPTLSAEFRCAIPRTASASSPARPFVYGHGLLGSQREAMGGSTGLMRQDNFAPCATDWIGMSEKDILNALTILLDVSNFASLADRSQQGFLNFNLLGRAMIHPDGFAAHPAFQDAEGRSLLDTSELYFDGNSQGAIMGGAFTALSPDVSRSVLGVPGMNYSTLLHRSVDWEGAFIDELGLGYGGILYTAYPDKQEQLLAMSLIQMLWDRAETNGYAHHMSDNPLPNTPSHQVLLHVALGDYQVANVSAEVEGRTMGGRFLQSALPEGRHWADGTDERLFAHTPFDVGEDGALVPHQGSAIVYWDSGNPIPPSANRPPTHHGKDPHEDPRRDPYAQSQKREFFLTGHIIDPHNGGPYCTHTFPHHEELRYDCDLVEVAAVAESNVEAAAPSGPVPVLPVTGGGSFVAGALLLLGGLTARRLLGRSARIFG